MTERASTSPPEPQPAILIVEDSAVEAELVRRMLTEAGYATSVAHDGEQGLAAARVQRPALVVSDINMPRMDGYQLCRAIKHDADLWNIPVILLTALAEPEDIIAAINCGADAYLLKNFPAAALLTRTRGLLEARIVRRAADERRREVVSHGGKRHAIASGGQQMLNLLLSLYENMLSQNRELLLGQAELDRQVHERTADLAASEDKFRYLFEHSPIGKSITSPAGEIHVNKAFCMMLGYAAEELRNLRWQDITHPVDIALTQDAIAPLLAGGQDAARFVKRYLHKNGAVVWGDVSTSLRRDEAGRPLYFVTNVIDVSERKRAEADILQLNKELEQRVADRTEKLEAVNKELEAFAYSVSHDLRSPLRAIDGFARKVMIGYGDKMDDEGRRQLQVVRDQAQRLDHLIDHLLAFSRMGRCEMAFEPLDMAAMARSVAKELQAAEPRRAIEFTFLSLPPARGDAAMLRQVWANLLGNAVKFSRQRPLAHIEIGGRIEVGEAIYWVKDDGAGFDMRFADKLFGVFQRLHTQEQFEGTGIGLANALRILHRHNGRIWAEGKPDAGATFSFALPLPNDHVPGGHEP